MKGGQRKSHTMVNLNRAATLLPTSALFFRIKPIRVEI
jgi:hypothetical protein